MRRHSHSPCISQRRTVSDFDYTPDCLVEARTGRLVCIEGKSKLDAEAPDMQVHHAAIRFRLAQVGVDFIVVTDADLACEASGLNAHDLVRGIRTPLSKVVEATLRRQIADCQPACFGALERMANRTNAIAALARGMAFFDTHQRLSTSTALVLQFREHFDAANVIFRKSTNYPF